MVRGTLHGNCGPSPATERPIEDKLKILIVDDDALVARSIARILRTHRVTIETDPISALERAVNDLGTDVIVCDLTMPGMNGMQFYEELGVRAPALQRRVVFLTGGALSLEVETFLEEVANPQLDKPVDVAELQAVVAQVAIV